MKFIISKKKAIEQYNWLVGLGLGVCYSVKTNPLIAPILEGNTNSMFCIHNVKNLGIIKDKSRVWFFPQAWKESDVRSLIEAKVTKFVVDNVNDLTVLKSYLENIDTNVDLLLRMKMHEHTIFTGRYFVFGMSSKVINQEILTLRKFKCINKLGIHFHRKSQNVSEWRLCEELKQSLTQETKEALDIVDIGGGFPANYKNTSDAIMSRVKLDIKDLQDWLGNVKLLAEPGRYISAPSGKLEVEIVNIYDNNIIVNFSVYGGAMDTLVVPIKLIVEGELEQGTAYTIKGISPCSLDIFRYKVFLKNPKVGDKIVFINAGAYNYHSDFCNLDKAETVIVD